MPISHIERNFRVQRQERLEYLETKFQLATVAIVNTLNEVRENLEVTSHIHARDIPFVDYATIASSGTDKKYRSLELHASGMWGGIEKGQWIPIGAGWHHKVPLHLILYRYAILKEPVSSNPSTRAGRLLIRRQKANLMEDLIPDMGLALVTVRGQLLY